MNCTISRPAVLAVACALALAGCTGGGTSPNPPKNLPSAEQAAQQLAAALAKGDVRQLPMTTPATAAQAELTTVMGGMDGLRPQVTPGAISYDGSQRTADVTLDQKLPLGASTWSWQSHATLRWVDEAWKLEWKPQVVQPELDATTRLRHTRDLPARASIMSGDGQPLVEQGKAYRVGIDKANLPQAQWQPVARQLAGLLKIDAAAYAKQVAQAGPKAFVPAITLREGKVSEAVKNLKGSAIFPVELPLAPSTTFAVGLLGSAGTATPEAVTQGKGDVLPDDVVGLSGLQKRYDARLRGTVGHTVELVPRSSASASPSPSASPAQDQTSPEPSPGATPAARVLHQTAAAPGKNLVTSLNRDLQARAENVLASQKGIASLVVVKVGSGELLAAANSPASGANPYATVGRFAPGSTFKVVTSLALLRKGYTPATKVPCTATVVVDGRTFKNYSDFPSSKVGNITLADALANSCNTAFISQHAKLTPEELAKAAESLGLGKDYDAGYSSFFGSVPTKVDGATTRAANMIGQGTVEASPMSMAGVAASVASGRTVVPWLVSETKPEPANSLTAAEAKQLQQLMQGVVANGSGRVLQGRMLGAKTGTAEFGDATKTHAWMIAWNKQYAVAAMVNEGESGSKTAAPLISALLPKG
ncbi:penicillin-binding transpeptidase domain-containing protein [Luteococcus peritonei]|uniref:Beta-lactamase n=1 Tax=Luteococcus peritonei TaxID=88874 RepID=A0ABW4RTI2_9ACTN